MSVNLETIKATFTADTSGLKRGVRVAKGEMKGAQVSAKGLVGAFGAVAAGAAALGSAAVVAGKKLADFTKWVAETGDEAAKTSQVIGTTIEEYQQLKFVTDLAGVSNSEMQTGFRRLSRAAEEARKGVAEYGEVFGQLGIKVTDSNGKLKSSFQLTKEISAAFGDLESETQKVALAQDLFGRSGAKLIPMLNQGADAIQRQAEEANKLGLVMSDKAAKQSEVFNDTLLRMESVFKGLALQLGSELLPLVPDFVEIIANGVRGVAMLSDAIGLSTIGFKMMTGGISITVDALELGVEAFKALGLAAAGNVEEARKTMNKAQAEFAEGARDVKKELDAEVERMDRFRKKSFEVASGLDSIAANARRAMDDIANMGDEAERVSQFEVVGGLLGEAGVTRRDEHRLKSGFAAFEKRQKEKDDEPEPKKRDATPIGPGGFLGAFGEGGRQRRFEQQEADRVRRELRLQELNEQGNKLAEERAKKEQKALDRRRRIKNAEDSFAAAAERARKARQRQIEQERKARTKLINDAKGVTSEMTGLASTIAKVGGASEKSQQAIGGVGDLLGQGLGVAGNIASGNILGAVTGGIGLLSSGIGLAGDLFGMGGGGGGAGRDRMSVEEFGRIAGKEIADQLEDRDLRPINIDFSARGDVTSEQFVSSIFDALADEARNRYAGR
jgi:hypothetical protein